MTLSQDSSTSTSIPETIKEKSMSTDMPTPCDVKREAQRVYDETLVSIVGKDAEGDVLAAIERAILAERQRCADIAYRMCPMSLDAILTPSVKTRGA